MLRLNNVQVIYSDVILVLKGLSLEVTEGQIVALLGANGAGKTTTLKAISGLLKTEDGRVTDGSIEFMGRRVDGLDPEDICRRGIVQVMEGRKIHEERGTTFLLVEQNAQMALRIADYGYIMENGRIVFDGPAAKLRGNDDVREFYLGLSAAGRRKSFKDMKFYKRRKRWAF